MLTTEEIKFWLSRYVLEVHKKTGDYYPLSIPTDRRLAAATMVMLLSIALHAFHDFLTTLE